MFTQAATAVLQADDFNYTSDGTSVTITGYTGVGGNVTIPGTINVSGTDLPVVSIGDTAFYNISSLTRVTIPSSVTRIGNRAFEYCRNLVSVTVPSSVTSIGNSAFYYCASLIAITVDENNSNYSSDVSGVLFNKNQTTLIECPGGMAGNYTIPSSVTSIGREAFDSCSSLAGVTIPSSVTSIGNLAFANCSSLASVTIPSSVASIGGNAFFRCSSLTAITVDANNPNYSSDGAGVLFNKNQTTLIEYPGGKAGNYTIPSSVTSIADWAFEYCGSLTDVTIPSNVTSIGLGTFWYCSGLTDVTIPSSVTSIGNYGFYYCTSLTTAIFAGNAPSMGTNVFLSVAGGFTVQYYAGAAGFASPTWTTSSGETYPAVNLGDPPASESRLSTLSVSSCILSPAFDSGTAGYTASVTEAVDSVQVTPGAMDTGATISVNGAAVASGSASAAIPLALGANTLTVLVTAQDGTTQSTYTVTVTRTASWVFTDGFEAAALDPFWTKTVSNAYIDAQTTNPVHSGSQAARFGSTPGGQKNAVLQHVFTQAQYGKVSVWFHDQMENIYFSLQAHNTNLSQAASLGVQDWDHSTYYCTAGKTTFPRSIGWHQFAIEFTADALTHSIDGQVVNISAGGTRYDKVMLLLSGPNDGSVVYDDFRFETYRESDKAAATVTLGNLAAQFDGTAKQATATTNPPGAIVNLTYDGSPTPPSAAGSYTVLATVNDPHYQGNATGTLVISEYSYTSNGTSITITGYTGSGGVVVIPGTINGLPVTSIGANAFYNRTNLTSVTIPSGVTSIEHTAFNSCTSLTSVTIPSGVINIDYDAFTNCTSLASVTIPSSVTSIGANAFAVCSSLTSVTIPSSVTSIGVNALSNCTSLTSITVDASNPNYSSDVAGVLFNKNKTILIQCPGAKAGNYTIPSSVTSIANFAFSHCAALAHVAIPSSVTSIEYQAFSQCANLASVAIPSSVTSIANFTFYACTSLTSVTIPSSVTSIGDYAFYYCTSLTSVTIPSGIISIGGSAFNRCASLNTAVFLGNAPTMGSSVFRDTAGGFTVLYTIGATGFTSPTWTDSSGDTYPAQSQSEQTLSNFPATRTLTLSASPYTLPATTSAGLTVTYSVVSGPATVSGSTLTLTGTGIVELQATQPGNATYAPFSATETITVVNNDGTPIATIGPALNITASSAQLNGMVNAANLSTTVLFQYGTDGVNFLGQTLATPGFVSGSTNTPVSASVTGLTNGITYYFRIVAINGAGTTISNVGNFVPVYGFNYATPFTFTTIAGSFGAYAATDGNGTSARFHNNPGGVTMDASGNLYIADTNNHTIRKVTPEGGVTTFAGTAGSSGSADGTGSAARFNHPKGLAMDADGNLYVTDSDNHTIRKITPGGVVATLAGSPGNSGIADGSGSIARFNGPIGITADSNGNIFVADTNNHTIRRITSAGEVTTLAGLAGNTGSDDGTGSAARFNSPFGIAVDANDYLFVTDTNNHTIRRISPAGVAATLAGQAGSSGSIDGTGSAARFHLPSAITVDPDGLLYVADNGNHLIRRITPAGAVITVAGTTGTSGSSDGIGSAALFSGSFGIVVADNGVLFVTDAGGTLRKGTPPLTPPVATIGNASNITAVGAQLNGSVNALYDNATVLFQYGTDGVNFPNQVQAVPGTVPGSSDQQVSATVSGLTSGVTYHFRISATNSSGTTVSSSNSFVPFTQPSAGIGAATAVSTTSVHVAGTYNAQGTNAQVHFNYGNDEAMTVYTSLNATPAAVAGYASTPVEAVLENLEPGTTYYYQLQGVSGSGVVTSATGSFQVGVIAGFLRQFPDPPAWYGGSVGVGLLPSGINAGWRFVGEQLWRAPGTTVAGLAQGNYFIQYRPVPGYNAPPQETIVVDNAHPTASLDREYYPTPGGEVGGMNIILLPAGLSGAQWRFVGEDDTQWRNSGTTVDNLIPGVYLVECKPVSGQTTPTTASLTVTAGVTSTLTLLYRAGNPTVGTQPSVLAFNNVKNDATPDLPFAFVGQIRSDVGSASGFVVKARVVATAAHVVFDSASLAYTTGLQWLFQRSAGAYEPVPQVPRGVYVFEGYAAQRTVESSTPGVSSATLQNLDVAALYFMENAGRGGCSGYLTSDAANNEFLTSSRNKILVGYPVDGMANADQGRMFATPPLTASLAKLPGTGAGGQPYRVYSTDALGSVGGCSGGPLCVQYNGNYYPAAIYLGGSTTTSVRSIDSGVVDLFDRAEISSFDGQDHTSGGVSRVDTLISGNTFGTAGLQVNCLPDAVASGGGGWKLSLTTNTTLGSGVANPYLAPGTYKVYFTPVIGYDSPMPYTVTLTEGVLTILNVTYAESAAVPAFDIWRLQKFNATELLNPLLIGPAADYDHDGVNNLREFAYNLEPKNNDSRPMAAGTGASGLPCGNVDHISGQPRLTLEFVRRKASTSPGISYIVEFNSSLTNPAGWSSGGAESVTSIDATWERVKVTDFQTGTTRFGRVTITQP